MSNHIGIVGASGFLGSHLIPHLLKNTDSQVKAISPNPEALSFDNPRIENVKGDVFDTEGLARQLEGLDVVYYFVHMMAADGDYYRLEEKAADSFGEAASRAGVKRVIYMSGLGRDEDDLSKHLASRHNTGDVLREYSPNVVEFRASMIIGEGSISFEILQNLVNKLPLLILPPTTETLTQPIALDDMLKYLTRAASIELKDDKVVEVGGPEVMSYKDLIKKYADWSNNTLYTVTLPYLPGVIAGWWLNLFNPSDSARVARAMVDSFKNKMIVTDDSASELFPDIKTDPIEKNFS